jgi:hypothetical protein
MIRVGLLTTSLLTFEEFERLPDHDEPSKREPLDGGVIRLLVASFGPQAQQVG